MDIRANLSIIPDPRIERPKKHLLVEFYRSVLSLLSAAWKTSKTSRVSALPVYPGSTGPWPCPTASPAPIPSGDCWPA
jgi:hypothetical protein